MSKSTPPRSLRNVPPDSLKLAYALSAQMSLSLSDVFRLALTSGLLVEAAKVAPGQDGTLAGWDGLALAKALRRHLGSAIDLLIEYEEHPYGMAISGEQKHPSQKIQREWSTSPKGFEQNLPLRSAPIRFK
jgi:hypothetical protein